MQVGLAQERCAKADSDVKDMISKLTEAEAMVQDAQDALRVKKAMLDSANDSIADLKLALEDACRSATSAFVLARISVMAPWKSCFWYHQKKIFRIKVQIFLVNRDWSGVRKSVQCIVNSG